MVEERVLHHVFERLQRANFHHFAGRLGGDFHRLTSAWIDSHALFRRWLLLHFDLQKTRKGKATRATFADALVDQITKLIQNAGNVRFGETGGFGEGGDDFSLCRLFLGCCSSHNFYFVCGLGMIELAKLCAMLVSKVAVKLLSPHRQCDLGIFLGMFSDPIAKPFPRIRPKSRTGLAAVVGFDNRERIVSSGSLNFLFVGLSDKKVAVFSEISDTLAVRPKDGESLNKTTPSVRPCLHEAACKSAPIQRISKLSKSSRMKAGIALEVSDRP